MNNPSMTSTSGRASATSREQGVANTYFDCCALLNHLHVAMYKIFIVVHISGTLFSNSYIASLA